MPFEELPVARRERREKLLKHLRGLGKSTKNSPSIHDPYNKERNIIRVRNLFRKAQEAKKEAFSNFSQNSSELAKEFVHEVGSDALVDRFIHKIGPVKADMLIHYLGPYKIGTIVREYGVESVYNILSRKEGSLALSQLNSVFKHIEKERKKKK